MSFANEMIHQSLQSLNTAASVNQTVDVQNLSDIKSLFVFLFAGISQFHLNAFTITY